MKFIVRMAVLLTALGVANGPAFAVTIIDTASNWNGTGAIGAFSSNPNSGRAFGQTFIVGTDNVLEGFSFYVDGIDAAFRGYVMAWDGDRVSGPVLYQSDVHTAATSGFAEHVFTVSDLTLDIGKTYLAFIDAGDSPPEGHFNVGILSGQNSYSGGDFFLSSFSANSFGELRTTAWDRAGVEGYEGDAAFRARLSVSEPTTLSLLGIGLLAMFTRLYLPKTRGA